MNNRLDLIVSVTLLFGVAAPVLADENHTSENTGHASREVREDVLEWIGMFFPEPNMVNPIERHGTGVLPVVTELLSKERELTRHQAVGALALLKGIDKSYPPAVSVVAPYLHARLWQTRGTAVEALMAVGSKQDVPVLIAMLYDTHDSVRWRAAIAIGKFGENPSLTALQIWREQVAEADKSRSPAEKWLDGTMRNKIDKAADLIRQRVQVDNAKGR